MYIIIYLSVLSLLTFIAFGIDKRKAVKGKYRISERRLLSLCLIGGSIGGLFGIYVFRHKTRVNSFRFGVPCIIILQIGVIALAYYLI